MVTMKLDEIIRRSFGDEWTYEPVSPQTIFKKSEPVPKSKRKFRIKRLVKKPSSGEILYLGNDAVRGCPACTY